MEKNWRTVVTTNPVLIVLGCAISFAFVNAYLINGGSLRNLSRTFEEFKTSNKLRGISLNRSEEYTLRIEILHCEMLDLAYIHIFKNAGTSLIRHLRDFCSKSTGKDPVFYQMHRNALRAESIIRKVCSASVCYTFWRDPVERFLSGYYELMKRSAENPDYGSSFKPFLINNASSNEIKLSTLHRIFNLLESHEKSDPHVSPQTSFLKNRVGHSVVPGLVYFELTRVHQILPVLFCGAHAKYHQDVPCPYIDLNGTRMRSREDSAFSQYIIGQGALDNELLGRIINLYKADYCWFGIPPPPATPAGTIQCA